MSSRVLRWKWFVSIAVIAAVTVPANGQEFVRGDANLDGHVDVSDQDLISRFLFIPGVANEYPASDQMDADDNGAVNISDVVRLAAHFLGSAGGMIDPPFPVPGLDPTDDELPTARSRGVVPSPSTGRLSFDTPDVIVAEPGSTIQVPVTVTLETTGLPVTAWSFGVGIDGPLGDVSATVVGTAADDEDNGGLVNNGVVLTQAIDEGVVSLVDLALVNPVETDLLETYSLLNINLEGTVPAAGTFETWDLSFRDGLRVPGEMPGLPLDTVLSVRGERYLPATRDLTIEVRGATDDWRWLADGNGAWDDSQNWTFHELPSGEHDVIIVPDSGIIVEGSRANQRVDSLLIGTQDTGRAVLKLGTGALNVADDVRIASRGEINLRGSVLSASRVINQGVLVGGGQIDALLLNEQGASVRVNAGERLLVTTTRAGNAGHIQVMDAEAEFSEGLTNFENRGRVTAHNAVLRFGSATLTNEGQLLISHGTSDVYGDILNRADITIAGAARVTFYDDVVNSGKIEVTEGSQAIYFDSVTGQGSFPGTGTNFFIGELGPGASPGHMEFGGDVLFGSDLTTTIEIGGDVGGSEHDLITSNGRLDLGGELVVQLIDGFTPASSDAMTIMVGDRVTGAFGNVAHGARIETLGGEGSFLVHYEEIDNRVILSDFRGLGLLGDFNVDGVLDATDIDTLSQVIRDGVADASFDVNGDGSVDIADRKHWIETLKSTYIGDANFDLEFDSSDFVAVLIVGKYETGEAAGWAEGDWDGDGLFNTDDIVAAFIGGGYLQGKRDTAATVPEPSSCGTFAMALALMSIRIRSNSGNPKMSRRSSRAA